ncbi:autotransporter assembly complex protein TamA [Mesorhizobium xinjiangense]|uniref:autotransporter assembly complex protein TamA n=1 Tax=Mesorhizobium xinjiangense TaxID=2678685 RepID=UPI0012ED398C|nr:autotransporter assembly complex family protein [Mesorhizobium xinjiangense]
MGAIALQLATVPPGQAFELFGMRFFERDREAETADIIGQPQPYSIDFAVAADVDGMEKTLKGASSLWQDRAEPASGAAGLIAKARGDYQKLLATLYSTGRYGGTISITIDGKEAFDLPPDARLANSAAVRVIVDPGPLFHFRDATVVNPAPPTTDRRDQVEPPAKAGFAPGQVARSGVILQAERLSIDAWRQQGHAKASVIERRVTAAHDGDQVDAAIEMDPGRRAVYGPVSVSGTQRMDPAFVAYMTGLKPGEEYDPDDLKKASTRLSRLDVFRSMRIEEADAITREGLLPLSVIVQERALRRIGLGGSYSTLDGIGLEAYWMHRNLFGRAERLRIEGRVAGIDSLDPDDFTYRTGIIFTKPGVYTPDTDFSASLIGEREVLDPYTKTGVSAETGFTHVFTDELSGRLFVNARHARFEDDTFGTREFTSAGLLGGLTYDTRDNPADATRGYYADFVAEPFYEFNYNNPGVRFTAEGRTYYGFGEDARFVLAGRVKLGTLIGPEIAEAAPDRLFFAGGGASVRGYAYRNIGVETPAGNVIGGRSLIEGSVELRTRVTETIGVVGFVDAGYVGEETFPDFDQDLKLGVGAGLRYLTPLGPIRLDFAVPIDPNPDDPDFAFYVGIGQAF